MKTISREALVPFSALQMFQLVDDIEAYPQFLPHCSGSQELNRTAEQVTATLSVTKGSFSQQFTTNNQNQVGESIKMELVDGPFKFLHGLWTFTPLSEQACKIELKIEFEFTNMLVGLAFGKVFNQLAESFVDAFSQRAEKVYG